MLHNDRRLDVALGKEQRNLHLTIEDLREQLHHAERRLADVDRRLHDLYVCECGSDQINHESDASWCEDCGRIVVQDGCESGEFIWIDPVTYEYPEKTSDMYADLIDHFYGHHDYRTAQAIADLWANETAQERRREGNGTFRAVDDIDDPNLCEHGCGRLSTAADCECQE